MPDVRGDGADEGRVPKHAQIEVRALASRFRYSPSTDGRDRKRDEADRAEDESCPAPPERFEEQACRQERKRPAEVEGGDVETDSAAAARGIGGLRDEAYAGHVDAGEPESGEDPQR